MFNSKFGGSGNSVHWNNIWFQSQVRKIKSYEEHIICCIC